MGKCCAFQCPACSYSAEVSGGPDGGENSSTVTIVCDDCQKLFDILVSWHGEAAKRKPPKRRCPCSAKHTIRDWKAGDPCPRCGSTLVNKGVTMLWD